MNDTLRFINIHDTHLSSKKSQYDIMTVQIVKRADAFFQCSIIFGYVSKQWNVVEVITILKSGKLEDRTCDDAKYLGMNLDGKLRWKRDVKKIEGLKFKQLHRLQVQHQVLSIHTSL